MAEVTVEQLAQVVKIPVDILLQQFRDAGLDKSSASDAVSDQEKVQLLTHLQSARSAPAKPAAAAPETPAEVAEPEQESTSAPATETKPASAEAPTEDTEAAKPAAVSYTHLTLPTIHLV